MQKAAIALSILLALGGRSGAVDSPTLHAVDSSQVSGPDSLSYQKSEKSPQGAVAVSTSQGITYMAIPVSLSWQAAADSAVALGGHLVTINDVAEQEAIASLVSSGVWWIGATDAAQEGVWKWVTGEPLTYSNWYPGEPNGGISQNYAFMSASLGYRWIDHGAGTIEGFIVEMGSPQYPLPANFRVTDSINETYIRTLTPTFSWGYVDTLATSQSAYHIQVGTDLDWSVAEMWNLGPISSATSSIPYGGLPLSEGTMYFVRVRVRSNTVWGDWIVREFTPFLINGHTYLLITNPKNWRLASATAASAGGHLVTITNANETAYITNAFGSQISKAYIGATDSLGEGNWLWTTGEPWIYTNWYGSEPNNGGGNEDFAEIRFDLNGQWNDETGLGLQAYIIEWEASTVPQISQCFIDNQANNSHVITSNPRFTWNKQQPPAVQTQIEIEIGSDTLWNVAELWNPAPFVTADTFITYGGAPLVDGTTYYLRLRAFGASDWSSWHSTSFRLNSKPSTPNMATTIQIMPSRTPTLRIQNSIDQEDDPLTYTFQLFSDSLLFTTVAQGSNIPAAPDSTGWTVLISLGENARYWWRVRARDGYEFSDWSQTGSFYVNSMNEPPDSVLLLTPLPPPGTPLTDPEPLFSWQPSGDPDPFDLVRYKFELSLNPFFLLTTALDSLTVTEVMSPTLLDDGRHYFWRVTAFDTHGLSRQTSGNFWTAIYPTVEGSLENLHVLADQPEIGWNSQDASNPQTGFEIAVGIDDDWTFAEMWNPAPFASGNTTVAYNGSPLQDGETYYCRVRISDVSGTSPWFSSYFRMNSAPNAPQVALQSGELNSLTPILYAQNSIDAENDTLSYEYEVYSDNTLTTLVASGTEAETADSTGWEVSPALDEDAPYWWRTRAYDGYEYSDWSATGSFVTNAISSAPSAAALLFPPDSAGQPIFNMLPTFQWTASTDPDPLDTIRYKLEISINPGFTFVNTIDSIVPTQFTLADSLSFGTHYWWRVTAFDTDGHSVQSSVGEFWTWLLGDMNHSHSLNILDVNALVTYLFAAGPVPSPVFVTDVNHSCSANILDVNALVSYLFASGPPLKPGCTP